MPRTDNLHAAGESKHITVLGRDGRILPCSQDDALIGGYSLPTLSFPSGSPPHLAPWWDQGPRNPWQMPVLQPELADRARPIVGGKECSVLKKLSGQSTGTKCNKQEKPKLQPCKVSTQGGSHFLKQARRGPDLFLHGEGGTR